jgi:hypothetical protein
MRIAPPIPFFPKLEKSVKKKIMNLTELTGNAEKALRNLFEEIY